MDSQDTTLSIGLQNIKEALIGSKFVTDMLLNRVDKNEDRITNCESGIAELRNNSNIADERITTIQRCLDNMSGDTRTIRNAVIGAIIASLIMGVTGLAISAFGTNKAGNTTTIVK